MALEDYFPMSQHKERFFRLGWCVHPGKESRSMHKMLSKITRLFSGERDFKAHPSRHEAESGIELVTLPHAESSRSMDIENLGGGQRR